MYLIRINIKKINYLILKFKNTNLIIKHISKFRLFILLKKQMLPKHYLTLKKCGT